MITLHVSLAQQSYIVPILNKLKNYFNIRLYFIFGKYPIKSSINLLELEKLKMVNNNLIIMTQKQFNIYVNQNLSSDDLYFITSYKDVFEDTLQDISSEIYNKTLSYTHGIDEEIIIMGKPQKSNLSKQIELNFLLYSPEYKSIIYDIYKIDTTKKTVVFFETTSIWIFKKFSPKEIELQQMQKKILECLVELKKMYNIILRFHPQDYYGYMVSGINHCSSIVNNHFIVDYTPIPVANFYEIADVVITSRFSSSGYQALFAKNKNMIILESDFDLRKKYTSDYFIHSHSNGKIEAMKENGSILSDKQTHILYENNFEQIYDILENIEIIPHIFEMEKNIFVKNNFGIDRYNLEELTQDNGTISLQFPHHRLLELLLELIPHCHQN
jgi:hypothetical protein